MLTGASRLLPNPQLQMIRPARRLVLNLLGRIDIRASDCLAFAYKNHKRPGPLSKHKYSLFPIAAISCPAWSDFFDCPPRMSMLPPMALPTALEMPWRPPGRYCSVRVLRAGTREWEGSYVPLAEPLRASRMDSVMVAFLAWFRWGILRLFEMIWSLILVSNCRGGGKRSCGG